uniref:Uncharacterized protein n=1 Tax=Amblyomma aureolatum TaxID=187763 RepID=A0A1E1WYA8_9ACAR
MPLSDEELERLAREEILRETKLRAERAKDHGAYGWQKPRIHPTNKNFLKNTLLSTLTSRRADRGARKAPGRLSKEESSLASDAKGPSQEDAKQPNRGGGDGRRSSPGTSDRKRTHDGVRKSKQ